MLRAHRQAWCWQDEWYGLKLSDIRRLERETQLALAQKMADVEGSEGKNHILDVQNDEGNTECEKPKIPISASSDQISGSTRRLFDTTNKSYDEESKRSMSPAGYVHKRSFSNASRSRSYGGKQLLSCLYLMIQVITRKSIEVTRVKSGSCVKSTNNNYDSCFFVC